MEVVIFQGKYERKPTRIVYDYKVDNFANKATRVIFSYVDYVKRVVWEIA